uniref:Uncharacterized protein n=1 Tax=Oryza brachyantha TaxID=4533 RepID=J3LEA0_ORYBR
MGRKAVVVFALLLVAALCFVASAQDPLYSIASVGVHRRSGEQVSGTIVLVKFYTGRVRIRWILKRVACEKKIISLNQETISWFTEIMPTEVINQ